MLAKSKIELINKNIPKLWIKKLSTPDIFNQCKIFYEQVPNYIIFVGQTVGVLSSTVYCDSRIGRLYTCITIKNETIFLDSSEIEFEYCDVFENSGLKYSNKTPKFEDCIPETFFSLDLL